MTESKKHEDLMWYTAVATFGIGDIVTTKIGMDTLGVHEAHPLSESVLAMGGTGGMIGMKALAFTGFGLAYGASPEDYRSGIPIGLSVLGSMVVINNLRVIAKAKGLID